MLLYTRTNVIVGFFTDLMDFSLENSMLVRAHNRDVDYVVASAASHINKVEKTSNLFVYIF